MSQGRVTNVSLDLLVGAEDGALFASCVWRDDPDNDQGKLEKRRFHDASEAYGAIAKALFEMTLPEETKP